MTQPKSQETRRPRAVARLSESLDKNLLAYAVAAAAAGTAVLAGAQSADAEVVYTPKNITLGHSCNECGPSSYPIDLNNDGITDLLLVSFAGATTYINAVSLEVYPCYCKTPNAEVGTAHSKFDGMASALPAGVQVGSGQPFVASSNRLLLASEENIRHHTSTQGKTYFGGKWANGGKGVKNHYLGVKFLISGQVHYGWVRLTINLKTPAITGWAYETVVNQPITTGFPHEADDAAGNHGNDSAPQGATLGILGLGARGVEIRNRAAAEK